MEPFAQLPRSLQRVQACGPEGLLVGSQLKALQRNRLGILTLHNQKKHSQIRDDHQAVFPAVFLYLLGGGDFQHLLRWWLGFQRPGSPDSPSNALSV